MKNTGNVSSLQSKDLTAKHHRLRSYSTYQHFPGQKCYCTIAKINSQACNILDFYCEAIYLIIQQIQLLVLGSHYYS